MAGQKKKKKNIFDQRNEELNDIYNYQQGAGRDSEGVNPNVEAETEYPNLKKKRKKRGLFG